MVLIPLEHDPLDDRSRAAYKKSRVTQTVFDESGQIADESAEIVGFG